MVMEMKSRKRTELDFPLAIGEYKKNFQIVLTDGNYNNISSSSSNNNNVANTMK